MAGGQQVRIEAKEVMSKDPSNSRPVVDGAEGQTTFIKTRKLDKLIEHLLTIRGTQFTGYIKINFSQGNIGRIEKFEEILKS